MITKNIGGYIVSISGADINIFPINYLTATNSQIALEQLTSMLVTISGNINTTNTFIAGITGGLNQLDTQFVNISGDIISGNLSTTGDLSGYNLYGSLQTQPTSAQVSMLNADYLDGQHGSYYAPASSIPTSATFLADYDVRFVNISGDSMLGDLTIGSNVFISSPKGNATYVLENESFGSGALYTIGNHPTGPEYVGAGSADPWMRNTAIGYKSLYSLTGGRDNTVVGAHALETNIGSYNTVVGSKALKLGTSSNSNTVIGCDALYSGSGDYNTAIGSNALFQNTGNGNVALGFQAGSQAMGDSNKLYISNSDATSGDVLIFGDFDAGKVWIKGNEVLTTASSIGSSSLTVSTVQTSSCNISFDITECDSTLDSGYTATLPTAVGATGKPYVIKKVDASINKVRVTTVSPSSQFIDGDGYYDIINQYDFLRVYSNGTHWGKM